MKGEMKAQVHSTVPEYQVPFGCPSPGESCSPSPENRASFESLATIPDEGHSSGPDENTDDIVLPSNTDHASSDARIRSLLGVPSITASMRSCNGRRGSPLHRTPSSGPVPLYSQGAILGGPQDLYPYSNATDITSNSSYVIYSSTPNPPFQRNEPQSYSDVASIISCPSTYPSLVGEMQPVRHFSASSNIYTPETSAYDPATSGDHSFPGVHVFSGYEGSKQRAYPSCARTYPPSHVLRGKRNMTRTSSRSPENNFHVSGSQRCHPYPRYVQLPQDAEREYLQRTPFNKERSPENFANSSPFQSSGDIIDEGSLLYQHSQQLPLFPNPELHLGNFSEYAERSF